MIFTLEDVPLEFIVRKQFSIVIISGRINT